jgi:dimethylamine/trimethylamine dehydrogenase
VITGLRVPRNELYDQLIAQHEDVAAAGIESVQRIGDALAPGAIVHAVHSGHKLARELGATFVQPYRRDTPIIGFEPADPYHAAAE